MSTLNNKTREICLIGILSAVNIASRVALQALPNFKPVTSIIIISVLLFGLSFGIKLTVVTTIASNMILGMGTWTIFQILSWVVICLFTQCISDFYKKINKEPPLTSYGSLCLFNGLCLWICRFTRTINYWWSCLVWYLLCPEAFI